MPPFDPTSLAVLAGAAFLAATVQAATGFGYAALAMPVFLVLMNSLAAVQVTAVVSLALSLLLVPRLWRRAPRRLLGLLVAGSLVGFPIGLAAFLLADVATAKLAVGVLTGAFAAALLAREWRAGEVRRGEGWNGEIPAASALAVGLASGILATALAMPGPLVVLYLLARGVAKEESRAVTLTLFLFSYAAATLLHALLGGMSAATWGLSALLAPVALAGAVAGHVASRHLSERQFRLVSLCVLLLAAAGAIASAL